MKSYSQLPKHLQDQLKLIIPSVDGDLKYYPCDVILNDGSERQCVYLVEQNAYMDLWGLYPEDDPGKKSIPVGDIKEIKESIYRLPPALANKLYKAGESGMGYCLFQVRFIDGTLHSYVTGGAVDFIKPPALSEKLTTKDAVEVYPHKGDREQHAGGLPYYWCLYGN